MVEKLNVYTPGDGIFETHVTWSDIEQKMQEAFKKPVSFGPNKSVKNIGDGNGHMSKICLIDPDWQGDSVGLPKRFIAKICTALPILTISKQFSEHAGTEDMFEETPEKLENFQKNVWRAHNNEVAIYELLDKYNVKVPRCKVYYSQKFTDENPGKGYLLMEFKDNLKSIHVHSNFAPDELTDAIRGIAAMNAMTAKMTEDEKSNFTTGIIELVSEFFNKKTEETMIKSLRASLPEEADIIDRLEKVYYTINNPQYYDTISEQLGMTKVMTHGDLWNTNILWQEIDNQLKLAAVIDFQTASLNCSAGDLLRLFMSNLSGKDRLEHTDRLLRLFYQILEEELGDEPLPYTFEQLKQSYEMFFPIAAYMIVPMFGNCDQFLLPRLPEEERAPARKSCMEKFKVLVTELVEYYEKKNLNSNCS